MHPEHVWAGIQEELDRKKEMPVSKINYTWAAAAASVILITAFSIYLLVSRYSIKSPETNYTEKENKIPETGIMNSSIYNPELCKNNPQICKSPVFIDLEKQLHEVKSELDLINGYMRTDDPQMMKYYYRLENTRVEIEKKMVKIILQS